MFELVVEDQFIAKFWNPRTFAVVKKIIESITQRF